MYLVEKYGRVPYFESAEQQPVTLGFAQSKSRVME